MNNKNIEEIRNRKIDKCIFTLYCVPISIYYDYGDNKINIRTIYMFYGCNISGERRFIDEKFVDEFNTTSSWYGYIQTLKSRGINQVLYAVLPNNRLLNDALVLAFKNIEIIKSIYIPIEKLEKYLSTKSTRPIKSQLRKIYLSNNIDEYYLQLDEFYNKYGELEIIKDLIGYDLEKAKDVYKYDLKLRKAIISYYFIRGIRRTCKSARNKKSFKTSDEFITEIIDKIKALETGRYCSKKDWLEIISLIYSEKKELIKNYL